MTPFEDVRSGGDPAYTPSGSDLATGLGAPLALPGLPPTLSQSITDAAAKAAQLWAASQRQRRQPCVMSPMDEATYFQNPKVTQFALLIGVDTIVCPPDPQRIAIIFSYQIPAGGILYLNPGNAIKSASPSGIILPVNAFPFIVRHDELPGLPQQLWHAMSPNGNMPFNVVEVTLRQWSK